MLGELPMKNKKDYVIIFLGAGLMAVAIKIVYEPMDMVTGGVSGIALVVKYWMNVLFKINIPLWVTNAAANIPLLLIAYRLKGNHFMKRTIYAVVCFTLLLGIIPAVPIATKDYLLAAVVGGVITGVGLGMVFLTDTSTGGTDLLGIILQYKIRHFSVAQILMVIDSAIVLLGAVAFGISKALYAVIAVYITAKIMDGILEGIKFSKLVFIISEKNEEIAKDVLYKIDRGVTALDAKGVYSNDSKEVLLCAVSKKEIISLLDVINEKDKKAFVIVTDAREIMGEGFIEFKQ